MFLGNRAKFLTLLFGLLVLWGFLGFLFLRPSGPERSLRFQLRRGLSAQEVARDLRDNGLLRHRVSFLIWAKLFGAKRIHAGVYELSTRSTGLSLYRQFVKGPPLVKVTFPEGWMASQMAAQLETQGICRAKEFLDLVRQGKHEGYLFPDTYFFEQETSPRRIIDRLLARFQEVVPQDMDASAKALGLKSEEVVTLASLVEKEARVSHERALIAGVFINRLRKKMYLESCATVEFALGAWKPRILYKDLQVNSPYNTYRHPGLPPGPICNPGLSSLEAALHPATTDMLFFVADGQGSHRFSRYYKDHLHAQKKR